MSLQLNKNIDRFTASIHPFGGASYFQWQDARIPSHSRLSADSHFPSLNTSGKTVGNTMPNKYIDHLTVTTPPAVPHISIVKMPRLQTAAVYQSIRTFTQFLRWTLQKTVGDTMLKRIVNHWTVSAPPEVAHSSVEKMPQFPVTAVYLPIRTFTRFLHITPQKANRQHSA